jgi:hypothetical protein
MQMRSSLAASLYTVASGRPGSILNAVVAAPLASGKGVGLRAHGLTAAIKLGQ